MGVPVIARQPIDTPEKILQTAEQIRRNMALADKSFREFPPVVILNLIACPEPMDAEVIEIPIRKA